MKSINKFLRALIYPAIMYGSTALFLYNVWSSTLDLWLKIAFTIATVFCGFVVLWFMEITLVSLVVKTYLKAIFQRKETKEEFNLGVNAFMNMGMLNKAPLISDAFVSVFLPWDPIDEKISNFYRELFSLPEERLQLLYTQGLLEEIEISDIYVKCGLKKMRK